MAITMIPQVVNASFLEIVTSKKILSRLLKKQSVKIRIANSLKYGIMVGISIKPKKIIGLPNRIIKNKVQQSTL
jgi:hypothetical protein